MGIGRNSLAPPSCFFTKNSLHQIRGIQFPNVYSREPERNDLSVNLGQAPSANHKSADGSLPFALVQSTPASGEMLASL